MPKGNGWPRLGVAVSALRPCEERAQACHEPIALQAVGLSLIAMATDEYKDRFIPSFDTISKAAAGLPPADTWRTDKYHVPLGERLIEFRRIKMKTKTGRSHRWVYEGKILV
jgi:hypothetical protein